MGLSSTLSFAKLGLSTASKLGKGVYRSGELLADQVKLGAVYKQENLVKQLFKNATKGSAISEMVATQKAGGSVAQIASIGLGGFRRTLAESNMAFTEARMEAAGTYTDLYDKMYNDYTDKNGRVPDTAAGRCSDLFGRRCAFSVLDFEFQIRELGANFFAEPVRRRAGLLDGLGPVL